MSGGNKAGNSHRTPGPCTANKKARVNVILMFPFSSHHVIHAKGTINNNNIFFCKSYRSSGIPYRHPGWTLAKRMIQCIKSNLQRILVMSQGRPLAKHTYVCYDIFCKWIEENSSLCPYPRLLSALSYLIVKLA